MPFGAHETMEVHESLNEKINTINHFSLYAQQAQHPMVRELVERHLQQAVQCYNQLVAYTHNYQAASGTPVSANTTGSITNTSHHNILYGLRQPAPVAPHTSASLDDQQILSAVLSCHKNTAKNSMSASLECADPNVREMLIHGALDANNGAYEVFLLMNQQGQYQVPTLNDHTAKTFLHTFQPAPPQPGFQQ
ncbi:spore coat protein [Paenibacillus oenotherae]|uniref:Spore coat protein n=1 Tax=Paenibacillus oenotherae TaxID=1435645 RepID=A0ABS7D9L0_9BACL|nr:spore coat protein [Paenibacillus oenotherae]MBW7476443.1 spore coat protein [Paenibacillus oenotherae]